jgi:membrane fusion protein (multidrug efflux system)
MSAQDVEELKQQVALAKADFKQKKADLKNYQMVAPFDGQLTNFTHSLGSRVEAATALVTLIKLDPVEVHYAISQSEVGKAKLGQPVSLTVDAYGTTPFTGRVDYIAPQVDENSGRIEVHAHFDNADGKLVPGMFAKVSQGIGDSSNQVIVSQTSVGADGDQRFVWVVENGKAVKHPVEIGQNTNNGYVAITSGLEVGEKVVITGQQNLQVESEVSVQGTKSPVTLPAKGTSSKAGQMPQESSSQPKEQQEQPSSVAETNHEAA